MWCAVAHGAAEAALVLHSGAAELQGPHHLSASVAAKTGSCVRSLVSGSPILCSAHLLAHSSVLYNVQYTVHVSSSGNAMRCDAMRCAEAASGAAGGRGGRAARGAGGARALHAGALLRGFGGGVGARAGALEHSARARLAVLRAARPALLGRSPEGTRITGLLIHNIVGTITHIFGALKRECALPLHMWFICTV